MQLKNISDHRPKNLIIDVAEEDVRAIIKTGEFKESIKDDDTTKLKQSTCDVMLLIDTF